MYRRTVVAGIAGLGAAGVVLGGVAPAALGTTAPAQVKLRAINYQPAPHLANVSHALTTGTAHLATWTAKQKVGGSTYTVRMVGKNPFVAQSSPSTTVTVDMIPLIVKAPGHTFNPTVVPTGCDGASAVTRMQKSPLFTSVAMPGEGTTQYLDAFQRANFDKYTTATGINRGYHVLLKLATQAPMTITVTSAEYAPLVTSSKCSYLGGMDINYVDNLIRTTLIPHFTAVNPRTLPYFLINNLVMYNGTTSNCCILGYHSAETVSAGVQTYGIGDYDTTGDWRSPGIKDISIAAHELGEWMDDPYVNNSTPSWGNIGQVSGCQGNLEVGDPLTGTDVSVTANGYAYSPQELTFYSWFYRQSPSIGRNGWYSSNGTFTSPSAPC